MFIQVSKFLTKSVLYTIVGVLLLVVMLVAGLRSSYVQTRLAQHYAPILSKALGYPIEIDKVTIRFFDEARLEGVRIKDYQGIQMIDIEKIDVDFQLKNLLQDSLQTQLDYVRLYRPNVKVVMDKNGDMNLDEFIRRINKLTASPTPNPTSKPTPFIIKQADIVNGIFSMDDQAEKPMHDKRSFDHYHFTFHELNAHLADFTLIRNTVALKINLSAYDRSSNTRIKKLKTTFLICDRQMRFDDLVLKLNNTVIRNQITMSYRSQKDFKDWNELVFMHANFDSSVVYSNDLGRFVNDMYDFKDVYYLNGNFEGTVHQFNLKKFDLYFGKNSKLHGDFAFKGLPSIPKTQMDLRMRKSTVQVTDLIPYIGKATVKNIEKFGHIRFDGTFNGTTSTFKTAGLLASDLGKANVDVAMALHDHSAHSSYKGQVTLERFKLGELITDAGDLGDLTLSGKIEGKGFSIKTASLNFDGVIKQVNFNRYTYRNISVDGTLKNEFFKGIVAIADTNLRFNLYGDVDFSAGKQHINLIGKLNKANLKQLNFTADDWRVKTEVMDVSFNGLKVDDFLGRTNFTNTTIGLGKKELFIENLQVSSSQENSLRHLNLFSDLIDIDFLGNFLPSKAVDDLSTLVKEYKIYFTGDEHSRQIYYAQKHNKQPDNYKIDYRFVLKNSYPILALLYPDGHISRNTLIEGSFGMGNTSVFNLSTSVDTLVFGSNYTFYQTGLELNSSKFFNTPEILAGLILNSERQKMSVLAPTEKLEVEASWDKDRILFTSNLKQIGETNRANLNGDLRFIEDGIELQFIRSKFKLLDQDWIINPENTLTVIGNQLTAKSLVLSNTDQLIALDGTVSSDSTKSLKFTSQNFKLETLTPILGLNLKGTVNGEITLKDVYRNINANSNLGISNLMYDDLLIGDLAGEGRYDQERQLVDINYYIERLGTKVLILRGVYNPKRKDDALDILASLNQTDLLILEPFTKGIFSKFRGNATGELTISGTLRHPILEGVVNVKKGSLFFDYLNTTLNFEDKIYFEPDEIRVKNMPLVDEEGNKAILKGGGYYDGGNIFTFSLDVAMNRFKILDTKRKDNNLYYGKGYATGNLAVTGTPEDLKIVADLKTERGTELFIPLDHAQEAGSQDEIEFLVVNTKVDSLEIAKKASTSDSRIRMDFNLELTPEASGEVQFDKQTGDIMHVNGLGKINMKIDTRGDFDMTGDYAIERGDYTFTFQNIINKKFQIQKGSKISWSGSPYDAILNIKALYSSNVSYLGTVIDTTNGGSMYRNRADFTRRYPADVAINITDRLLKPNVGFDLVLHDYPKNPEFNTAVTAFQNRIRTDEQELNRQVSNVLLLGQMAPNSAASFATSNLVNNLIELAGNQLSNVFSQIDKNLAVDLSLNGSGLNQDLINNLQVRFSYNFNDRFRITRSGGFTTATNQTNALSLIGDWSLEWFVKRDGSLRLKTYNRNVQTSILGSLTTQYQTFTSGGLSLLYSKSFNYFFPNKRKKESLENGNKPISVLNTIKNTSND